MNTKLTAYAAALGLAVLVVGSPVMADDDDDDNAIYVQAGADPGGNGTLSNPYDSLSAVEANSGPGDIIFVLSSYDILDGGIVLKNKQQLRGVGRIRCREKPHSGVDCEGVDQKSKIRNLGGDAITLANKNVVEGIYITEALGNGIFGKNVREPKIVHSLIKNTNTGETNFFCPVTPESENLRELDKTGCGFLGTFGNNFPVSKSAIAILNADTGSSKTNKLVIENNIINNIEGNGILLTMQGDERIKLKVRKNLIQGVVTDAPPATSAGLYVQLYDDAVAEVKITDVTLDNLRSRDWFRFFVGILGEDFINAELFTEIKRSQSLNTENFGPEGFRDGIESLGSALGYTLEIHVEDSSFVGVPNHGIQLLFAMFLSFPFVLGEDMLLDFGCVNPDPGGTMEDRDACEALGYTSEGGNRMFDNGDLDANLSGHVTLFAQGNWWGSPAGATNINEEQGAIIEASFPRATDPILDGDDDDDDDDDE